MSVFLVSDDERGLHQDYGDWLEDLAPHAPTSGYRDNRAGEACPEPRPERSRRGSGRSNGDAHLRRQIMGREVGVVVSDGRLDGSAEPRPERDEGLAEAFGP